MEKWNVWRGQALLITSFSQTFILSKILKMFGGSPKLV
jgi:hypothetical protein